MFASFGHCRCTYTYHDGDKNFQYMGVLMALGCSVLAPVSLRGVMEGEGVIGKCKSNAKGSRER